MQHIYRTDRNNTICQLSRVKSSGRTVCWIEAFTLKNLRNVMYADRIRAWLLIARYAMEAICCSAFVDTDENKSHIYRFRRNMASHQYDSKSRTLLGNHIQFLYLHHYQSTRQCDSILKTCLKWERASLL